MCSSGASAVLVTHNPTASDAFAEQMRAEAERDAARSDLAFILMSLRDLTGTSDPKALVQAVKRLAYLYEQALHEGTKP